MVDLLTEEVTLLKLELRLTLGDIRACLGASGIPDLQSFDAPVEDSGRSGSAAIPVTSEFDLKNNTEKN